MPPAPNTSPARPRSWLVAHDEDPREELVSTSMKPKLLTTVDEVARSPSSQQVLGLPSKTRAAPVPNTILDRNALTQALNDAGLVIKPRKIDYFYEHLHRMNYPSLPEFVAEYKRVVAESGDHSSDDASTCVGGSPGSVMSVNKHSAHYRFTRHRLPSKLLNFLALPNNGFVTSTSRIVKKKTSANGNHVKLVIELHDGLLIETNIQRYHEDGAVHASVSVCSQVGCDVGCSINCPTTSVSFEGNLFAGEITEQVAHAQKVFCRENRQVEPSHAVRKVSFMSGESLHNYQQVVEACHVLSNKRLWNLSHGRITVSTMGITPRIYDLTRDFPNVILCVGLHAPNQELRRTVVPVAEQYPLDELMAALDNHRNDPRDRINGSITSPTSGKKRRMVMVEYIMMEGKTSSLECAHELGRLCENRHLVVNLIPFIIAGDPETSRQCPPPAHIKKFQSIVASYGAICNVRLNMTAQKSEMVTRQMNLHKRQSVISDVPEEIDGLSFWQKLSFVRLRGWDKEALKERQEKRGRSSPGVPREIIARTPSSAGAHESDNKSAGSDILGLADQGTSTAEAAPISAPTLPVEEDEKQSPSEVASEHEHHHTRRLWILPAAITAVVLCKMLLYERRR